jgi:hypothetical protein
VEERAGNATKIRKETDPEYRARLQQWRKRLGEYGIQNAPSVEFYDTQESKAANLPPDLVDQLKGVPAASAGAKSGR